jgi:biopolymer transport protein ExbD
MKLRNFRTFLVLCATLLFAVYFVLWKFSEKPVYSFKVNLPKAYNPNFTDAEFWEYIESGNSLRFSEIEKRSMPIPHYHKFLYISVEKDKKLKINSVEFGNLENANPLTAKLTEFFNEREKMGVYEPNSNKIVKAVIIRAPRSAKYGDVAKLIDAVKSSGADPIVLQIDDLPE